MGDNLRVTGCPFIKCTPLPAHHRLNKRLTNPFMVVHERGVPDGTEVFIHAGNEDHNVAEVKNYTSKFKDRVARFNDLRFLGRSGRGKTFVVSIIIMTSPPQIASYENAIKVTVDGKRDPRKQKAKNGYTQGRRKRGFNNDNDRDDEDSIRSSSGSNDTSPRAKIPRCGSPIVPPYFGGFGHPHPNFHPLPRAPIITPQLSPELLLQCYRMAMKPPPVANTLIPSLSFQFSALARQFAGDQPLLNSLQPHPRIMPAYPSPLTMPNSYRQFQPSPVQPILNTLNPNFDFNMLLSIISAQARFPAAANNNDPASMAGGIQISARASNSDATADRGSSSSLSSATSSASVSSPSVAAASTSASASASSPSTSAQAKGNTPPNRNSANGKRNNVLTPSCATATTSGNAGGKFSVDRLLKDK